MRRSVLTGGAAVAVVLVILGVILLASGIARLSETRLGETRTSIPGEGDFSLEAQKYVIYYEVDEAFGPTGDGVLADPVLDITIREDGDSPLPTDGYSVDFHVSSGGRYAQAIRTVEPTSAGDYRLRVSGDQVAGNPALVLGKPVSGRLTPLLLGIVGLLSGLGIALFVLLAALLGRRRAGRPRGR